MPAFDHNHYVPILKTKAGERWAVDHATSTRKSHITPLFEIHPHASKDASLHAEDMCDDLASVWGTLLPLFLDTCWLHTATGNPAIIGSVFANARADGLQAIPVVRLSYDSPTLDVVADIVSEDHRGWLLRLEPSEAENHARIDAIVAQIGVPKSRVHLVLDYKNIAMHLPLHVPQLPHIADWRTFTAASAAFPRSLSGQQMGTWHNLPRTDWTSWQMGIASDLPRKPAFGDYTMRDSGPAADFGDPSVNLRYAKDTYWLVRIERKFRAGYAADMHAICADLICMPEFNGATYSDGDAAINATANSASNSGAPQQWLQWGMNHHMAVTVDQIGSLP